MAISGSDCRQILRRLHRLAVDRVTVDDAIVVRRLQRFGDLPGEREGAAQGIAFDEFHDDGVGFRDRRWRRCWGDSVRRAFGLRAKTLVATSRLSLGSPLAHNPIDLLSPLISRSAASA